MPRPEITTHHATVERICAYCDHYTFVTRPEQGWGFCKKRNKHFSGQGPELPKDHPDYLPAPGERTCEYWI